MKNRLVELTDMIARKEQMSPSEYAEYKKILYGAIKNTTTTNIDDIISKITERILVSYDVTREIWQKKSYINSLIKWWAWLYQFENSNPLGISKYKIIKYWNVHSLNEDFYFKYGDEAEVTGNARISFLRDTLSETEQLIFDMLILGNSYDKDVAELLWCSTQWATVLKNKLIDKLKLELDLHLGSSYL